MLSRGRGRGNIIALALVGVVGVFQISGIGVGFGANNSLVIDGSRIGHKDIHILLTIFDQIVDRDTDVQLAIFGNFRHGLRIFTIGCR